MVCGKDGMQTRVDGSLGMPAACWRLAGSQCGTINHRGMPAGLPCLPAWATLPFFPQHSMRQSRPRQPNHPNCPALYHPPQACAPCEPGTGCGTNSANNRVAAACQAGRFNDVWGASTCQPCPDFTASVTAGATRCQECAAGTTHNATRDSCQTCPAGTFNTEPGTECRNCPAGTYREAGGDGTECVKCAPGTFASLPGSASCTDCSAGRFAPDEGATTCRQW